MNRLVIFLLMLLLIFSGCVSYEQRDGVKHFVVPENLTEDLKKAAVCCDSFKDISYDLLEAEEKRSIKIDDKSP
ncbi:MAG: hypothetical protein GXP21_04320, partial [Gammaproteobacteria bacterium]|nr:hypothetical protein [Gammaproteobacteria bacterium]